MRCGFFFGWGEKCSEVDKGDLQRLSTAKTIVVSMLKSIVSNSLSVSSRRPEDVKMPRVVLHTERGRC